MKRIDFEGSFVLPDDSTPMNEGLVRLAIRLKQLAVENPTKLDDLSFRADLVEIDGGEPVLICSLEV